MINKTQLQHLYQSSQPVWIGIIGNSKACGFCQTGWESLTEGGLNIDATGLLTQAGQDNPNILGWAQNLGRWLKRSNSESIIYNYAGSGWDTGAHITNGTVEALANKIPKPVAVFIQMNVNDRLKDTVTVSPSRGGVSFDVYLENTRTLIRKLIASDILPILVKEDNCPMPAGEGWFYGEYDTGMNSLNTGSNDATHRPYSDYIAAYDTISADSEWITKLGEPITVLDCYTPTLNTGQEPQYRYQYADGTYDNSAKGLAPADFRYSLMCGTTLSSKPKLIDLRRQLCYGLSRIKHKLMYGTMLPPPQKHFVDVWHQSDAGGAIILNVYQNFFTS